MYLARSQRCLLTLAFHGSEEFITNSFTASGPGLVACDLILFQLKRIERLKMNFSWRNACLRCTELWVQSQCFTGHRLQAHTCNVSTQKGEAGGLDRCSKSSSATYSVQGELGTHETLFRRRGHSRKNRRAAFEVLSTWLRGTEMDTEHPMDTGCLKQRWKMMEIDCPRDIAPRGWASAWPISSWCQHLSRKA